MRHIHRPTTPPPSGSIAALKNVDALPADLTPAEAAILCRLEAWRKTGSGDATGRRDDLARAARCSLNHVTKCLRSLAAKGYLATRGRAKYCLILRISGDLMTQGDIARRLWQQAKATGQHLRRARATIGRAIRAHRAETAQTNQFDWTYTFPQKKKERSATAKARIETLSGPTEPENRAYRMHGLIAVPI
ncbi:MAG: methicillin resistance regulatory protein [Bacteriophage sp.]|nr:MAG: methicillin resistance regulatory protein [Bacteriophage sp.]